MRRCARPCRDYCTHERALLLTVSCLAATISPKREQCSQTREGEAHVAARDRRSRPGRLHHRYAAGRAGRAGPPRESTGSGPTHPAIERVAADATDAERLSALADGAAALYNCANPLYHRWLTDWPPLASSLLTAAERSGAVLVSASNLYGYGPVDGPITPETPLAATQPKLRLRAQMWRDALAAHQAGRLRTSEARASDYIEANSIF